MPADGRPACSSSRWTRSGTSTPTTASTASGTTRWPPSKPIYNDDFTEMTVKLRAGHLLERRRRVHRRRRDLHDRDPPQHRRPAAGARRCRSTSRSVEAPDPYTVVFKLKKPNSRFHALFTVRWNAMWMMPKHVFEQAGDPHAVRLQPAGLARAVHAAQLRPERQMVHLGQARRLGAHHGRTLRRARPEVRRLHRSGPAGQARDRAAQPRARHHPRRGARGHVHARARIATARTAGSRASPTPIPTRPCRR